MRKFIQAKLAEADSIVSVDDLGYVLFRRCEDLRTIVNEVAAHAITEEQPAVLDLCQSVRGFGTSLSELRSVLVHCLAVIPPGRPAPLLTVDEVAELLSISVRSVHRMKSAGELPEAVELGKSVRWRQSDIEKITRGEK